VIFGTPELDFGNGMVERVNLQKTSRAYFVYKQGHRKEVAVIFSRCRECGVTGTSSLHLGIGLQSKPKKWGIRLDLHRFTKITWKRQRSTNVLPRFADHYW
jgi:hypothetical protein